MGKKNKTPEYATTSYDTGGLFGSSTTGKTGTTYNPAGWMNTTSNLATGGINTSLGNMLTNDFANDPNFQAYQNQLNKTAAQNYDTTVLTPLANRGLMRSSGLQAATNNFADTLANQTTDLYDNYYNRQVNNLNSALNANNALFNYLTGVNQGSQTNSQNVSNYNMQKYQADQANKGNLWGSLAQTGGMLAGSMLGGPVGASLGSTLGNALVSGGSNNLLSGGGAGSGSLYV